MVILSFLYVSNFRFFQEDVKDAPKCKKCAGKELSPKHKKSPYENESTYQSNIQWNEASILTRCLGFFLVYKAEFPLEFFKTSARFSSYFG